MTTNPFTYTIGGTLAPDAPSYVERGADRDLLSHLVSGETCYVLNSRQMGKSSLCVRTIGKLKEQGVRTVFCDLTKFGGRNLTAEQWYAALLSEMGRDLELRSEFLTYWKENADLPPVQRLFGALVEEGLRQESPVVVFIDEIDVTLSLPFSADEFFAAIRQCYVGRATDERLKRLSFCLLGTATPADLIQDTRVSPFNIGKRIELRDFTAEEAAPLAAGLGDAALLQRVLYWTGGHPYLTQRLCQAVCDSDSKDVDRVCSDLFLTHSAKESDDNLAFVRNRLLKSEADLAALLDLYKKLRAGKRVPDNETNPLCALLKLSGVAKVESGNLKVRNRIYEHVFDRDWVETHLPDAEKRRQREAYRRGALKAVIWGGSIALALIVLSVLAVTNAIQSRKDRVSAMKDRERAERLLYLANIRLAQSEWEDSNLARVVALVNEARDSPYRGFEWYYWEHAIHPKSQLLTIHGHSENVLSLAFSPNGGLVATGSMDGTAKVWDAETGKELLTLKGYPGDIYSVAFSPDGKRIATASTDGTARVWDVQTGRKLFTLNGHVAALVSVTFAPDGRRLATASHDGTAKIWDAGTGKELLTLKGHRGQVWSVAFSPDGQRLATASQDKVAKVWDTHTGKELLTLKGHGGEVWTVTFSPDGKRLATASYDKTAKIWNSESGREELTLLGHRVGLICVTFSPDGKNLATCSLDGCLKLWDARSGQDLLTLRGQYYAAFSPNGQRLVTASGENTVNLWVVDSLGDSLELKGHTDFVMSVAFSSSGKYLGTASQDGTARLWDPRTGKGLLTLKGHTGPVYSLAFAPEGRRLATASQDGTARVWDILNGNELVTLQGHAGAVTSATFARDGSRVATCSQDGTAKLWDAQTGKQLLSFRGHARALLSVAISPDGRKLATAAADGTVKVWDAENGKELFTIRGHTEAVRSVAYSPDGLRLATASQDKLVKVWDARTGKELTTLRGHSDFVFSVTFSPDDNRIATASYDTTARVWDVNTGREVLTFRGHLGSLSSVAFSPDGRKLATGGFDNRAIVRDAATDQQVAKWEAQERERLRGQRLAEARATEEERLRLAKLQAIAPPPLTLSMARASWDLGGGALDSRWLSVPTVWQVSRGALTSTSTSGNGDYAFVPVAPTMEFDLWAEFQAAHDMHMGAWSPEDPTLTNYSGYIAFLGGYGNALGALRYGKSAGSVDEGNLATAPAVIPQGWHTMQFSRREGYLWLYFDGKLLTAAKDPKPTKLVSYIGFLGGWSGNQSIMKIRMRPEPTTPLKAAADLWKTAREDSRVDPATSLARFRALLRLDPKLARQFAAMLADGTFHDSASDLNEMAWAFIDPEAQVAHVDLPFVIGLGRRAVLLTKGKDPNILDTLALALYLNGRVNEAIKVEEGAVQIADQMGSGFSADALRAMQDRLKAFKSKGSTNSQ
ncbi:MAG: AAA-like domain-containing protein [Fimbriimonadaceae bacterium]|nr:AAA-like domain-containing protein [Fimbriimonadaceae bacterium]